MVEHVNGDVVFDTHLLRVPCAEEGGDDGETVRSGPHLPVVRLIQLNRYPVVAVPLHGLLVGLNRLLESHGTPSIHVVKPEEGNSRPRVVYSALQDLCESYQLTRASIASHHRIVSTSRRLVASRKVVFCSDRDASRACPAWLLFFREEEVLLGFLVRCEGNDIQNSGFSDLSYSTNRFF